MKRIYIFDVDGTLTAPRQPMDSAFEQTFLAFCREHPVYLVTGSDRPKMEEQLPGSVIAATRGVFTCSAAELWVGDTVVYRRYHDFPEQVIGALEDFINESVYPHRFGNHVEHRTGMTNVSVPGRNANQLQRNAYFTWDEYANERADFIERFKTDFPDYDASAGGQISIDITPRGWNKAMALKVLKQRHHGARFTFFGDRMVEGGNDWPLASALCDDSPNNRSIPVNSHEETRQILAVMLNSGHAELPQLIRQHH
ncbi:HAD-IIB family hydrolase [Pelagibius sp.]|uniref:HAD-IIB family hydrolase n=1 Tax=Pelagibius sp. TaxID=1931238 RepID=UPI003BB14091